MNIILRVCVLGLGFMGVSYTEGNKDYSYAGMFRLYLHDLSSFD